MEKSLATIQTSMQAVSFTGDEIAFIREKYAPNATDLEFKEFIALCQMHGANPFKRDIYFIKYGQGDQAKATIVFSYHWLLDQVEKTGLYAGLTEPEYADESGAWHKLWTDKTKMPIACKIGVYRKDFQHPVYATVYWAERAKNQAEWKNQPLHMLMKCAVSAAVKLAIPDLGTIHIREEMLEDAPSGEWTNDPTKLLHENAVEAARIKTECVNEKTALKKGGDLKPEKPSDELQGLYKSRKFDLDYSAEEFEKLKIRVCGKSKSLTAGDTEKMIAEMDKLIAAKYPLEPDLTEDSESPD